MLYVPAPVCTISLVFPLLHPPISTRPCSVCQLEWSTLSSSKEWLVVHCP